MIHLIYKAPFKALKVDEQRLKKQLNKSQHGLFDFIYHLKCLSTGSLDSNAPTSPTHEESPLWWLQFMLQGS